MKWSIPMSLLLATTLYFAHSMPTETTTRSTPTVRNTTKKMITQTTENTTSFDMVHDVRTPPKIKQQVQDKMKIKEEFENSHAGVAIPVDEDSLEMEETTKKLNFYKIEKPTTNSGLSTWILLSGQASLTTKPPTTRKPIIKLTSEEKPKQNLTVTSTNKPIKIVKPIFKQRPTTTSKPSTTTVEPTKVTVKNITNITKVKASVLNNSTKKVNATMETTTKKGVSTTTTTTRKPISSTQSTLKKNATTGNNTLSTSNSSTLTLESKTDEVEIPSADNKKKKSNKRKKNKNRRRKPEDKTSNITSIANQILNDKPIGTQLYNYLAREIMPTVGVGLVGLMVTAGLASYFLYPFGIARRSSEIDRKDKEGYYYNDYSGGMPEEEAIEKVIAGMPGNSLLENSYKSPTSRNAFLNAKYKLSDRKAQIQRNPYGGMVQGTVENVPITSMKKEKETIYDGYQSNYEPISYSSHLDSKYSPSFDQKYVVGNVPKEIVPEVTPAAVPEHGPRHLNFENIYAQEPIYVMGNPSEETIRNTQPGSVPMQRPRNLRIRRKRSEISNDIDNEIVPSLSQEEATTQRNVYEINNNVSPSITSSNATENLEVTTVSTETTTGLPEKINSFIDLMKELIHLKAKIGLQIIQNATKSISNYISGVQTRLDQHYREYSNKL